MEAAFGPKGTTSGLLTELPVLAEGQNLERNGLRCSAYNGGVACGNVSAGVGFFVAGTATNLFPKQQNRPPRRLRRPQKPRNLGVFLRSIE